MVCSSGYGCTSHWAAPPQRLLLWLFVVAQFRSAAVDSLVVEVGSPVAEVDHIAVAVEVRRVVVVEVRIAVVVEVHDVVLEVDRSFVQDIPAVVDILVVHPVAEATSIYRSAWRSYEFGFLFRALAPIPFAPRWQLTGFWPVSALFDKQGLRGAIGVLDKSTIGATLLRVDNSQSANAECESAIAAAYRVLFMKYS